MEEGLESYHRYQVDREEKPLEPGDAFALVQKVIATKYIVRRITRKGYFTFKE